MHTQYTIFIIKKKVFLAYPKSVDIGFSLETQERVRNSRGKKIYTTIYHFHNKIRNFPTLS